MMKAILMVIFFFSGAFLLKFGVCSLEEAHGLRVPARKYIEDKRAKLEDCLLDLCGRLELSEKEVQEIYEIEEELDRRAFGRAGQVRLA